MKIFVIGTRGIPGIPGGVEKHCEELYPRIAAMGHEVHLCTRKPYVTEPVDAWNGITLHHCPAPRVKSLEAIVHTLLALLLARLHSPDVVHVHAIGPALLVPLARLLGLRVVFTNHGPDYNREKWGTVAKFMLRLGELLGGKFANEVIVISGIIGDIIRERCGRESSLIFNGVTLPERGKGVDYLESIGARRGRYLLTVARLVPEKGIHDLIGAFRKLPTAHRLVIAGGADHASEYSKELARLASEDRRVIMTGYITGEPLRQIYANAGLFVLPSYHEGLPIALLEAMSHDLPVVVSDIPANKGVPLPSKRYFRCGDQDHLAKVLRTFIGKKLTGAELRAQRALLRERYSWERIAQQTCAVYRRAARCD